MMAALGLEMKLQAGNIDVKGVEHVKEIPPGRKIVVVSSHRSDLDMPITAFTLGNDLDLAIADMSTHHSFSEDPSSYVGVVAAGLDNFLPIDYEKKDGKKVAGDFNPDNFDAMIEALEKGKAVLIAGHNPSGGEQKVDRPGYGAAYLALMSNAVILPVSVRLKSSEDVGMQASILKTFMKKPDAEVSIGAPFELPTVEGIENFKKLLDKRRELAKEGKKLSQQEIEAFLALSSQLREKSGLVLEKVSECSS